MTIELFSLYAYDINTNTLLTDLPYFGLSYGSRVNDAGPIQFSLDLQDPGTRNKCSSVLALDGNPFAVYVDLNGVLQYGGIAWTTAYGKKNGVMQFGGNDWFSWLDHRTQFKAYTTTTDPQTLVSTVISDAQSASAGAGASIGLQVKLVSGTNQPDIVPGYPISQRATLNSIVQDITKIMLPTYGGVDVTVSSAWDTSGNPQNTLTVWTPRAGRQGSNASVVFDLDSCEDYSWPTDASKMGTTITVTGAGTGNAIPSRTVQTPFSPVGGLGQPPRMDKVVSYSAIQSQTQISAMASGAAQQYGQPLVTPQVTFPTRGLVGSFIAGDDARVRTAGDFRFPNGLDEYWRIASYDVTVPDAGVSTFTATLNPPPTY